MWNQAPQHCSQGTAKLDMSHQVEQDATSAFFVAHPFVGE